MLSGMAAHHFKSFGRWSPLTWCLSPSCCNKNTIDSVAYNNKNVLLTVLDVEKLWPQHQQIQCPVKTHLFINW